MEIAIVASHISLPVQTRITLGHPCAVLTRSADDTGLVWFDLVRALVETTSSPGEGSGLLVQPKAAEAYR